MKIIIIFLGISLISLISVSNAAECQFKQPQIDTNTCKTLNLSNKIQDNPYFIKNITGACGLNFQLSGLPDLSVSDYVSKFQLGDACQMLKYVNGDKVISQINSFLK